MTALDDEREQIRSALCDPWRVVVALGLDQGDTVIRRRLQQKIQTQYQTQPVYAVERSSTGIAFELG